MTDTTKIVIRSLKVVVTFLMLLHCSVMASAAPVSSVGVTSERELEELEQGSPVMTEKVQGPVQRVDEPLISQPPLNKMQDELSIGYKDNSFETQDELSTNYNNDNTLEEIQSKGKALEATETAPKPIKKTRPAKSFEFRSKSFSGAGSRHKGYKWNGCSKTAAVTGGFGSSKKCSHNNQTMFNADFGSHLQENFMPCVRNAAKKAGLGVPKKVFLKLGTVRYNRRKNTPSGRGGWSHHAYGRALDIFGFNLHDTKKRTYISAHQSKYGGQNRLFYNNFVACWDKSVRRLCGKNSGTIVHHKARRSLRKKGHRFYANHLHADHIHLEFPHGCAKKRARKDRKNAARGK